MVLIRGNLIDGDRQTTARVQNAVRKKSPEKFKAPPRAKSSAPRQTTNSGFVPPQWLVQSQPRNNSSGRVPQKAATRDPAAEERRQWEESKKVSERNKSARAQINDMLNKPTSTYDPNLLVPANLVDSLNRPKNLLVPDDLVDSLNRPKSLLTPADRVEMLNKPKDPNYIPTNLDPDSPLARALGLDTKPGNAKLRKQTPEDKKKRIAASNERFYAEQIRNRRGTGDYREMTLEDYEALSPTDRAAVDANSILMEAIEKDKGLISKLDKNKDGRVTSAEAKAKATYGKNHEALFGRGGDDVTYAPNTVAALRLLEQGGFTVDDKDTIDNFLSGGRYVTARDMDLGRTTTESEEKPSAVKITGSMEALSMALEEGMAVINGQQGASINLKRTTPEQQTALVESIQADMLAGRSFDALFNPESTETPVSLDAVYDEAYALRRSGYQWMMDQIISDPTVTEEAKITTLNTGEEMQRFAEGIGIDFDMSEWTELLKSRTQPRDEEEE